MSSKSKRVHFAPTNTVYSPLPSHHSPALSEESLPSESSSSEVSTPPPQIDYSAGHYPRTPYPPTADLLPFQPQQRPEELHQHHPQLQSQTQSTPSDVVVKLPPEPGLMQIHYRLAFNPDIDISIRFDLSFHWSQISDQMQPHELAEPATYPPLTSIIITSPNLPWSISATNVAVPGGHVTVQDIFYALFRYLRVSVSPEEYEQIDPVTRKAVDAAYHLRTARITDPQISHKERNKGIKRVDYLLGRNLFKGLSGTLAGPDIWELNVA